MSVIEENVRQGRLEEALAELQAAVRKAPAEAKPRVLLFQVLCILGEWERAMTQLNVLGDLDAKTLPMVQTYGTALKCEEFRAEVFAGKRTPLIFGEPARWAALLVQSLVQAAQGHAAEAHALHAEAFDLAPASSGKIDGQAFAWLADADPRLGPMLEAVIDGKYYWVPFGNLSAIRIDKPTDLRDLVWIPAFLTLANGGEVVALIPTRYPGSEASADPAIRMARKTEWLPGKDDTSAGLGQRMFATDQGDYSLLEVRSIAFDAPSEPVGQTASDHG
ncbi:MAG: tetratricopeptide repeat protein [Deltaproteobacteria bacterium]|nr:tetratricopeptide repeat protein [Deltaproteobacteria bacterium]